MLPMLMPILATSTLIADYSALFSWLPAIMLGILASASLVAVYYVIGVLLGNNRIKASAASEFGQIIGTALLIAAILWVLGLFNSASFSLTTLLSISTVHSICGQLANAHIDFISTTSSRSGLNHFICNSLVDHAGSDITANLDYGLASAYVILANMTNQSLTNLNAVFVFESYTGLLTNLQPFVAVCEPTELCMLSNPYTPTPIAGVKVIYSFNVFKGYGIFRGVVFPMAGQATLMVYMYLLQMIVILILLYGWPYILAGGIILRSFLFTRRTGGLLIAIAVVGLLIYPFLFVFEYVTLSNAPSPIGLYPYANGYGPQQPYQIPQSMQLIGLEPSAQNPPIYYGSPTFNFFVFPRADYILNYNGCWPLDGSMVAQTLDVFIQYIVPGYSLLASAISLFTSSFNTYPAFIEGVGCTPDNVIKSLIAMINLYGWMSVTGVILPLINILISISAVRGLSSLFGGDTNLLGIGKLV